MRHLRLVMIGVFAALFLMVSQAQMSSAQAAGASLEIHKRVCPADATGLTRNRHRSAVIPPSADRKARRAPRGGPDFWLLA